MAIDPSLLKSLSKKFANGEFDKFIHSVCFPKFKNFAPGTKISFRFPVTLVVGPNGGGKSSLLQTAWGMPLGYSTSRFWFSTPVDPINFDPKDRPRFWYSHYIKALKEQVQTRKITGNKNHGYWEPTRPAIKDGMLAMPVKSPQNKMFMSSTGDRWTPVSRTPRYYNAKNDSSAFDRFFNSATLATLDERQGYFIRYSAKLREVIDEDLNSYYYYGVQKVNRNQMLTERQLKTVNSILGKKYKSARYISHKFYDKFIFSPSVIFETDELNYSECFAGSGELAVVNFVLAMEDIETFDLLLLDEPETSLHPGAQEGLMNYLLRIVNEKKIQVIISTHSDTFVRILPSEALLVLDDSPDGIIARPDPRKSSAFHRLGVISDQKIVILTEDKLLQKFVERSISILTKEDRRRIRVEGSELGASEMLSNQLRAHIQSGAKALMVLDGDMKPVADIYSQDPDTLSPKQKMDAVESLKLLNVSIVGGAQGLDSWMKWCAERVLLLDELCPEKIYLSIISPCHPALSDASKTNGDFKSALRNELKNRGDDTDSAAMASTFKQLLGTVDKESAAYRLMELMANKIEKAILQFED